MKLYYCFNGLYDYEYPVNDEKILEIISKIIGEKIEYEAVKFYLNFYREEILNIFLDEAYWEYLSETKADFIDEKRLSTYQNIIAEEDKILGVKR